MRVLLEIHAKRSCGERAAVSAVAGACCLLFLMGVLAVQTGCTAAAVGGAAAGAYAVGSDERPVTKQLDDAAITLQVKQKLLEDPEIKAFSIDVDTYQGVVSLTGVVSSKKEAERAIQLAGSVPGVRMVKNNLQMRE